MTNFNLLIGLINYLINRDSKTCQSDKVDYHELDTQRLLLELGERVKGCSQLPCLGSGGLRTPLLRVQQDRLCNKFNGYYGFLQVFCLSTCYNHTTDATCLHK